MFQHGIEDDQQFPHAGDQCDLLGLAGGAEPLIEIPNHRVESSRNDRSHVQGQGKGSGVFIETAWPGQCKNPLLQPVRILCVAREC